MKRILLVIPLLCLLHVNAQSYLDIHKAAIVIDTHNDILTQVMEHGVIFDQDMRGKTHSDLARWKKGGLDAQFFSVWSDGLQKAPFDFANRQLDTLDAVLKRNPDKIVKVANSKELLKVVRQGKIAAMAGVEGGHQIENDLEKLDSLYRRGVRYMTLTWNNSTSWATSAFDETFSKDLKHKGLTDSGKMIVKHMNSIGMMVDISHVGEQTFWDVMKTTSRPVIASHSSVYALCPHQRNLKDEQIKAVAKNGGVIQINFYPGFLDSNFMHRKDIFVERHKTEFDSLAKAGLSEFVAGDFMFAKYKNEVENLRPPLSLLIQHIEYIIKLVGVDYVGLGSDFDGIELSPLQLDDVTSYPLITKALIDKGYTREDLAKILGGNILRVMRANESR